MFSSPPEYDNDKIIDLIYHFAINQNFLALSNLLKKGYLIDVQGNRGTAIKLLAQENKKEAVNFLLEKFNASQEEAIIGYAFAGQHQLVNILLECGVLLDHAIYGYALGKHHTQVYDMITKGGSKDSAAHGYATACCHTEVKIMKALGASKSWDVFGYAVVKNYQAVNASLVDDITLNLAALGYAQCGDHAAVNELLLRGASLNLVVTMYGKMGKWSIVKKLIEQGASIEFAIQGFAWGGHYALVKQFADLPHFLKSAMYGYAKGGHHRAIHELLKVDADITPMLNGYKFGMRLGSFTTMLHTASLINKLVDRQRFVELVNTKLPSINPETFLLTATKLNYIICNYALSFEEARGLLIKGARTWLLQGQAVMEEYNLPVDIYNEINSHLLNLPIPKAENVRLAVIENLFADTKASSPTDYQDTFFQPRPKKQKTNHNYEERKEARIKYKPLNAKI